MPCQPSRTRHTMRPNWVEPTLLVMKIAPNLGSPDPGYLKGENDNNVYARV